MAKQKSRRRNTVSAAPTPFEQARDELFQHVIRCGVIGASSEHQNEWFDNTIDYFADRYPELTDAQVEELRTLGQRFAQPAKGKAPDAIEQAVETTDSGEPSDSGESVEHETETETENEDAVTVA
jgi:hypothetical protein